MGGEPQLFRVQPENHQTDRIKEVDFSQLGFQERRHIQEWVAANPGILGDDLLIIGKEFSGFDRTNERLDLLAVDSGGKLVIIELKRDDSGTDAHWQAIKYASYFQRAKADRIIRMAAEYRSESEDDATTRLLQHLGADDLNALNYDQRIILASHRFAPEVTSAALWLNQKDSGENLITCVTLTPYQDTLANALYVQATTIIPAPGIDDYVVGVGDQNQPKSIGNNSFAENLKRAFNRNRDDEVTHFLRKAGELTLERLRDVSKPDRTSKWGAGWPHFRYYHLWYSHDPWNNHGVSYRIRLLPQEDGNLWTAEVMFAHLDGLEKMLSGSMVHPGQRFDGSSIRALVGSDALNDDFAGNIADVLCSFIERITPIVDELENETDADEEP